MSHPLLLSQVGRRLLLRFVLAALLPMGGVALFAYAQVGSMLVDLNYRRLQQDSRALGMGFIEAFNWRAQSLKREAARMARKGGKPAHLEGFENVSLVNTDRPLNLREAHHLDNQGVLLRLSEHRGPVLLARIPGTRQFLEGRLNGHTIWLDEEAPEHYCVVGTDFHPLFCTPGLESPSATTWPQLLADRNLGVFDWRLWESGGQEPYLAAFWQARMQAAYAMPGFIVMVADPKQEVLKGLDRFHRIFPATLIAALALATLLTINQIRRQMRPLEQLTAGTRRLADGDLGTTVQAEGHDEFAVLAGAFNHMSGSLKTKFHMLEMLSELDRAILGASEMDYLITAVLTHIHLAVPCDYAGVVRIDSNGKAVLLTATEPRRDCGDHWHTLFADPELPWLRLAADSAAGRHLQQQAGLGLGEILVFPSRVNQRIDTLLILAYAGTPANLNEILSAGRSVADRLAVAASNLAWEEKLYHQAHYDALTDLPNRALLRDRVEQALVRADREHTSVAVMLLDLDNFKQVNDTLGHSIGDALLVECAHRLQAHVRHSDTVVRLGGDEFIVLLPDLPRGNETATLDVIARNLNQKLREPISLGDHSLTTLASIGIALYPDNAGNHEDLLKMADAAMYESKRQQHGSFRFYSAEMNAQAHSRFELSQDLRAAVTRGELDLYYQPKVDLVSGRYVGAEALVRWLSPTRGVVPPGMFVPLLGEMGLEDWLSDWVLETACTQLAAWDRLGLPAISVSVNLSPGNFEHDDLLPRVHALLDHHGLDPWRLELEILETTAVSESAQVRSTLTGLREMQVGIALDDFGTGYSSLVYLTQLPANILKLDRAFISNLVTNPRQQAIVERIIALAKTLDFQVVAEGVEDEAQREMLARMHCDLIQGFLISPPLPAESFLWHWRENIGNSFSLDTPGSADMPTGR